MIKRLFFLLLFFCVLQSHSQKLVYKSNGTILNSENQQISPDQVRILLKDNQKLLADYNAGMSKKKVGNILLFGGSAMVGTALTFALIESEEIQLKNSTKNYITAINYIGMAALVVAIPVKIGFSKKIKNVVNKYNYLSLLGCSQFNNPKLDFITNANGIGLRLYLN